jgi:hypothetical protein
MADPVDALILDLLEWIGPDPKPYAEVIAAWRTSCPRLPVWEDANDRGFVESLRFDDRGLVVGVTPLGSAFLAGRRPHRAHPRSAQLSRLGHESATGRDLFVLQADSIDEIASPLALPSPHFACLVVADGAALSDGELHRLAARLLASGAVYLSSWGPACERVHDVFDDAILFAETSSTEETVIMTTWHDEPLEDALAFFLACTSPAQAYEATCRCGLVVVLGHQPVWSASIRDALADPAEFLARVGRSASDPT